MTEVGSAFVSVLPSAKGFGPKLSRDIGGDLDTAGREGGKRFGSGMASSISGFAGKIVAPFAAAFAGVAIGGFFKDAIGQASDLAESGSKVGAIFGDARTQVEEFANKGAKALGQTKLDVLDAASTFGTFGKAAGLTGGDLAKFSTGFAGLSTDLASFFNTSPEEAVQAIGAALRGEAEPIRKYGVLLDDASLRQEALRLGLIKTTKQALTPQQKVLAAQAAIYKQTKDAQGDFVRTSGGLANQQRILSAQWTDMKGRIGRALLPAITGFVTVLNNRLFPALGKVKDAFKGLFDLVARGDFTGKLAAAFHIQEDGKVVDFVLKIRDAVIGLYDLIVKGDFGGHLARAFNISEDSPVVGAVLRVRDGIKGVFDLLVHSDFSAAFARAFNVSEDSPVVARILGIRDRIVSAVTSFGDLPGKIAAALTDAFSAVRPDVSVLVAKIKDALAQTGSDLISGITTAVQTGDFTPLGKAVGDAIAKAVIGVGGAAAALTLAVDALFAKIDWGTLGVTVGKKAVPFITGFVISFIANLFDALPVLKDHWQEAILAALSVIPIGRIVGKLAPLLREIPILRLFAPLFDGVAAAGRFLERAIGAVFRGLGRVIGEALDFAFPAASGRVKGFFDDIITSVYVRVTDFFAAGRALILGMLDGIRRAFVVTLGEMLRIPGALVRAVGDLSGTLVGAGRSLIGGMVRGIAEYVTSRGGLIGAIRDLPRTIIVALGDLGGLLYDAGRKLIAGLISGIKSKVGDVGEAVKGIASKIKGYFPGSPVKEGPLTSWNRGGAGLRLMDSLATGISKGQRNVEVAVGAVAGAIALPAMRSNAVLASAAPAGGFTWYGDIIQNGADPNSAASVPMALRQLAYARGM